MKAKHAGQVNTRRQKALLRLKEQLNSGYKNSQDREDNTILPITLPLTEFDIKRINKEISILEGLIVSDESARAIRTKKYRATR